jgi:Icc-related predicted phosphoesterase
MVKILYTSDMHGNEKQYKAFVDYALEVEPNVVIIGGELLPKGAGRRIGNNYIPMQRAFLKERFPRLLNPIGDNLPDTKVFVLPGNDDCSVVDNEFRFFSHLRNINGKRVSISGGLEIVGYSNVPITPFGIKDREKFDLTEVPEKWARQYQQLQRTTHNLHGIKSEPCVGWKEFSFTDSDRTDSIQKDLESPLFTSNPTGTIYVFHTPMNNTALDTTENGIHVGSFAVRDFIEKYQPLLTLHGHIHESVEMSRVFSGQIENSLGMSAGNHNEEGRLAVLVIDTDDIGNAKRVKLPCTIIGKFGRRLLKRLIH